MPDPLTPTFSLELEVSPQDTATALSKTFEILNQMASRPLTLAQIENAKTAVLETQDNRFASGQDLIGRLAWLDNNRVPYDYIDSTAARIERLTPSALQAVAEAYLQPEAMVLVVLGPAELNEALKSALTNEPGLTGMNFRTVDREGNFR